MRERATPEARAQHAVRLKMADDKWAELVADEHYEDAADIHKWYWTVGFTHGLREAQAEIDKLREAICRLADQDATLSVCNGNVTVDCSTELKLELTEEQRAVLAQAIENDRKRGVMLVPGPQVFTLTDEEQDALAACATDYEDSAALCYERMHCADGAKRLKRALIIRDVLRRLGGAR